MIALQDTSKGADTMFTFGTAVFAARNYLSPVSSECMVEEARHEFTAPIAQAEVSSSRTPTGVFMRGPLTPGVALSATDTAALRILS